MDPDAIARWLPRLGVRVELKAQDDATIEMTLTNTGPLASASGNPVTKATMRAIDEKVFVIQVENTMGHIIGMFLRDTPKERPLTHDLMNSVLKGFGISVERVVITELKNSTYFARLFLHQNNELGRKLVEIDARPSDCLALAIQQHAPIYVSREVWEEVVTRAEVGPTLSMRARTAWRGEGAFDRQQNS